MWVDDVLKYERENENSRWKELQITGVKNKYMFHVSINQQT
jgi:hypothetical protein